MNRKTVTTLTMISLTLLFGFVAINGQTRGRYSADIPFEFAFGNNVYDTGRFELVIELPGYDANVFTLRGEDGKTLERAVALRSGNRSKDQDVKFVFDKYDHGYVLKEVVGPGFGFAAPKPSEAVWVEVTQNRSARPEKVIVAFRKVAERAP